MNSLFLLAQSTPGGSSDPAADSTISDPITEASTWLVSIQEYAIDQGPVLLMNIGLALIIFFIGRMIVGLLTSIAAAAMRRGRLDDMLIKFAKSIIYWGLMLFVIMAVLDRLGIDTTSFAAVLAAAGLAVGLALQDSLSNFASGVMLIVFHPFRVGNYIEAGGTSGIVEEIQIFNTIMRTPDNKRIIIPNNSITSGTITNYAAHDLRRIDLVVMCGYGDDLRQVRDFLEETLAEDPRILDDPAPLVAVDELADNGVNLVVRPWVKTSEYWDVKWSLTEAIKNGFDDRGFSIPYPTRDINIVSQPAAR